MGQRRDRRIGRCGNRSHRRGRVHRHVGGRQCDRPAHQRPARRGTVPPSGRARAAERRDRAGGQSARRGVGDGQPDHRRQRGRYGRRAASARQPRPGGRHGAGSGSSCGDRIPAAGTRVAPAAAADHRRRRHHRGAARLRPRFRGAPGRRRRRQFRGASGLAAAHRRRCAIHRRGHPDQRERRSGGRLRPRPDHRPARRPGARRRDRGSGRAGRAGGTDHSRRGRGGGLRRQSARHRFPGAVGARRRVQGKSAAVHVAELWG